MTNRRITLIVVAGIVALALLVVIVRVGLNEAGRDHESDGVSTAVEGATGESRPRDDARTSEPPGEKPSDQGLSPGLPTTSDALPDVSTHDNATEPRALAHMGKETTALEMSESGSPGKQAGDAAPAGWHLGDDRTGIYSLVSDSNVVWSGSKSASVLARSKGLEQGDAFVWQAVAAEPFRGQRLRFSAYLKIANIAEGAHLTLRAEDATGRIVAFDNMSGRWIQGSTDWRQLVLVVDIPETASVLIYGAGFIKPGTLWIDEIELVQVDKTNKVTFPPMSLNHTNTPLGKDLVLPAPFNLGFEAESAGIQ